MNVSELRALEKSVYLSICLSLFLSSSSFFFLSSLLLDFSLSYLSLSLILILPLPLPPLHLSFSPPLSGLPALGIQPVCQLCSRAPSGISGVIEAQPLHLGQA